jgi:hypothetical protein
MRVVVWIVWPVSAQRMQVWHFQVRAAVTMAPGVTFAIDPHHLHARGKPPHAIEVRVIAHMQHLVRRHTCRSGRGLENAQIGLGHTGLTGTDRGMEMRSDAHPVHIGIAVGQGHHRVTRAQKSQRRQGVFKQRHALALGKKDLERRTCQRRVFASREQQSADGLLTQKRQVMRPFGVPDVHLLTHGLGGDTIARQNGRGRCMLLKPVQQNGFGTVDRGPHRPEGVVQVKGDGADAGKVKHGEGE